MQEDVYTKAGIGTTAFLGYFAGLPAEVVMGSLLGAIFFTTAATEYSFKRRLVLAFLSFVCGLIFFSPAATIFISVTGLFGVKPEQYEIEHIDAVGAFVSALLVVKLSVKAYGRADIPKQGGQQ
ncbi:putative holin [Proteus mirabilis]